MHGASVSCFYRALQRLLEQEGQCQNTAKPEATVVELTSVQSAVSGADTHVRYSDPQGKVPWTLDAQVHMPGNLDRIDVVQVRVDSNPLTGSWLDFLNATYTKSELDSEYLTLSEDGASYFDFHYYKNLLCVGGYFHYTNGLYRTRTVEDETPENPVFTAREENEKKRNNPCAGHSSCGRENKLLPAKLFI